MEKGIVFLIKIQMLHVLVDFPLMEKEIVYGYQYLLILYKIHKFQLFNKYLFLLQLQCHKPHIVHLTFSQTVLEIVLNNIFQWYVELDM